MKSLERFAMKHPFLITIGLTLVGCFLLIAYIVLMHKSDFPIFLLGFVILLALLIGVGFLLYFLALKMIARHAEKNYKLIQKLNNKVHEKTPVSAPATSSAPAASTASTPDSVEILEEKLKSVQKRLVEQEKMVTMGILSAGIAHEIKNPLNFINNFSEMTLSLIKELKEELIAPLQSASEETKQILNAILNDISVNCEKINEHGKRASSIIQNMLIHARTSKVDKLEIDVNALLEEYLNLAYHGMRAQNSSFNAKFEKALDKNLPKIKANQQSLGRVFINIINNGLYAANEKAQQVEKGVVPTISITTLQTQDSILIKIKDNGGGIPAEIQKKIFEPFFTTKPAGQGTGLGLPICYDIVVNELGGKLEVSSKEGEYTEFTITIPKDNKS